MALQTALSSLFLATLAAAVTTVPAAFAQGKAPLTVETARVSLAGTSNIHEYTASTTQVRVLQVKLAPSVTGPEFWTEIVKPGALQAFDIAVPVATLSSPKEGLDKNMHKALQAERFADITFALARLEGAAGAPVAVGTLRIAGVAREVAIPLTLERRGNTLAIKGKLPLLMTDYGVKPPTAMLGMLKTDPKVTVTFEAVLAVPLT